MTVLLPIAVYSLLFFTFLQKGFSKRESFLSSLILMGCILVEMTELLSLGRLIELNWLIFCWGLIFVALGSMRFFGRIELKESFVAAKKGEIFVTYLFGSVACLLVITFIAGTFSAPSNWDSMSYHLSRVMHWIQGRSVVNYQTACLPQLYQPPFAEYAILQLNILASGDRFAFLPQWLAYLVTVSGVSLIARELGCEYRSELLAAVVAATTPAILLQAESTQNALVVTAWLVCLAYFILRLSRTRDYPAYAIVMAGSAAGLALLTKGTAYVIGAPFGVWMLIVVWQTGLKKCSLPLLAGSIIAVALNLPHVLRNERRFNALLVPSTERGFYETSQMTSQLVCSNLLRNAALNTALPIRSMNELETKVLMRIHYFLKLSLNDPRVTSPGQHFHIAWHKADEDLSGNPIHFALAMLAIAIVPFVPVNRSHYFNRIALVVSVVAALLLFCVLIKWQRFNVRLQLPIFALSAPLVGIMLGFVPRRMAANLIIGILVVGALPYLLNNSGHAFFGKHSMFRIVREEQYFANRIALYQPYLDAADYICSQSQNAIALAAGADDWEYPFWVLLHDRMKRMPNICSLTIDDLEGTRVMQVRKTTTSLVVLDPSILAKPGLGKYFDWQRVAFGTLTVFRRYGISQDLSRPQIPRPPTTQQRAAD